MINSSQKGLFVLQQSIRDFFRERNFLDVIAPPAVPHPGMEAHLHPFQLFSKKDGKLKNLYLHTSPEFALKKLISEGLGDLFSLGYSFRDEPDSKTHRCQFLMLEWYRVGARYEAIESDVVQLLNFCGQELKRAGIASKTSFNPTVLTLNEAFLKWVGFSFLECETKDTLREKIERNFPQLLPAENLEWEDLFFLLFLNVIEPQLKKFPLVILKEYPASMAALATLKAENPRVCERFEVYLEDLELANCFNELTDLKEQKNALKERPNANAKRTATLFPNPMAFIKLWPKDCPPVPVWPWELSDY